MLGNAVLLKRFTCSQATSDPITCITGTSLLTSGFFIYHMLVVTHFVFFHLYFVLSYQTSEIAGLHRLSLNCRGKCCFLLYKPGFIKFNICTSVLLL